MLGNPPWDKIRFEEDAFYMRYIPGLIGLPQAERKAAIRAAKWENQRIEEEEACERGKSSRLQTFFSKPSGVYHLQGSGHLDLAKLFLERMMDVLSSAGHLGIVLPRQCPVLSGWSHLRTRLFERHMTTVIQLRNRGGWVFYDAEHRYVVSLISRNGETEGSGKVFVRAGARDEGEFTRSLSSATISWDAGSLRIKISPTLQIPLLLRPGEEEVLFRLSRFCKLGSQAAGLYQGIPYAIVDVGKDIGLIGEENVGIYLTRTRSILQFNFLPEENCRRLSLRGLRNFLDRKFRSTNWFQYCANETSKDPLDMLRLIYRYLSRNDDARSLIATYLPKGVCPAVGYVHGLVMPKASISQKLFILGFLNSIVWDWLARRFVDRHITSSVVQMLPLPEDIEHFNIELFVSTVASLLRHHDPSLDLPEEMLIENSQMTLLEMLCSVNVQVARALRVTKADMELLLEDFTKNGVDANLRETILADL